MELLLVINIAAGLLLLAGLVRLVWPRLPFAGGQHADRRSKAAEAGSIHTSAV